jgi:predicted nucleotidyltransferase
MAASEVLDDWRERIERLARQESAALAALSYVKGIAVVGGTGRGTPWPLSDVDMLVAAEIWRQTDPEELIRRVEVERNARLDGQGIPNDIEPSEWVVLARDLRDAVTESEDAFFARMEHPYWLGIVIKAQDGRVFYEFDGQLEAFLQRCNDTFYMDRFIELWVSKVIAYCGRQLARAECLIHDGEYMQASIEILRATCQKLLAGAYAIWRVVPQSGARSVSRFLTAAGQARESAIADLYLAASRLDEKTTWERFDALPPQGVEARDLMWAIRRGAGEEVNELSVTRDILNLSLWKTVIVDPRGGVRPPWTGATGDAAEVVAQYGAAHDLLEWLCGQLGGPMPASTHGAG